MVMVQNPSIVLSIFMVTIGKIGKFAVVIDAHNEGIMPFYSKFNWLAPLYGIIQRWADLTIVTNESLAMMVRKNGGRPFVLPDKIPEFGKISHVNLKGKSNAVFICTFAKDEPWKEVIQAANLVDPSVCIYITGKYQRAPKKVIGKSPQNVVFTGFLPDQEYLNLLYSCDIVIDLTLMDNCLVCGAYESIALGKPVILSDAKELRAYFKRGAVYCGNNAKEISEAIIYALENLDKLKDEMKDFKEALMLEWEKRRVLLLDILENL